MAWPDSLVKPRPTLEMVRENLDEVGVRKVVFKADHEQDRRNHGEGEKMHGLIAAILLPQLLCVCCVFVKVSMRSQKTTAKEKVRP